MNDLISVYWPSSRGFVQWGSCNCFLFLSPCTLLVIIITLPSNQNFLCRGSHDTGFERIDWLHCEFGRYVSHYPLFFSLFLALLFQIWRLSPVIAIILGPFSLVVDKMTWIPRRSVPPFWFLRPVLISMRIPSRACFGTWFITRSLPNWFHPHYVRGQGNVVFFCVHADCRPSRENKRLYALS